MNILNQKIDTLGFDDIVNFCNEGIVEGIQLEYKQEIPQRGLSKHFASFSNSRGGLIIIGVSENQAGKPDKAIGIKLDSKIIDKIHQFATSVEPRPIYDVAITNEKGGKVFILVRVFEGYETPYYVQNDPNIYVRSGNTTDLVDIASPKAVELLFGKRDIAQLSRRNYFRRSNEVYKSAIKHADIERKKLIAIEKENYSNDTEMAKQNNQIVAEYKSRYFQENLGSQTSMLTLTIQPYYPKEALLIPSDIKSNVEEYKFTSDVNDFPSFNLSPIQDGVIYFMWGENDGKIECQQLYSNGLLYHADDVLRQNEKGKRIYIDTIASNLFIFLKSAGKFFIKNRYQGSLIGKIQLSNIGRAKLIRLLPNGYSNIFWDDETKPPLMNDYVWNLETDTLVLCEDNSFQNYYFKRIRELYWSVGYENPSDQLLKAFLKDKGWLVNNQ